MRITLSTDGTLGDLLPYVALGQALSVRGHQVRIAASRPLHEFVTGAGLEAVACHPNTGPDEVRARAEGFDHWTGAGERGASYSWEDLDLEARVRDLLRACEGADLYVRSQTIAGEAIAGELLGIPCVDAVVAPERCWSEPLRRFLRTVEDESGGAAEEGARAYFAWHQRGRLAMGLPEAPAAGSWKGYFRRPALLAASRHLFEGFDQAEWNAEFMGFWFYAAAGEQEWRPDAELEAFLRQTPAPMVLSFSSQPLADPRGVVEMHVEAARKIGRPLLIQSGWAGMEGEAGEGVLFRGFLPQDWLFARAACLITHGGIGTVARAAANGCPMLVEPWGNDQFFNALAVVKAGLGAAAHPKEMGVDALAAILEQKVLRRETKERAERMAGLLGAEDGLRNAVRAIEAAVRL